VEAEASRERPPSLMLILEIDRHVSAIESMDDLHVTSIKYFALKDSTGTRHGRKRRREEARKGGIYVCVQVCCLPGLRRITNSNINTTKAKTSNPTYSSNSERIDLHQYETNARLLRIKTMPVGHLPFSYTTL
jgi:hypothetical protein